MIISKKKLDMLNSDNKNKDIKQKVNKEVEKPFLISKESNINSGKQGKEIKDNLIKNENIEKESNNKLMNGGTKNEVITNISKIQKNDIKEQSGKDNALMPKEENKLNDKNQNSKEANRNNDLYQNFESSKIGKFINGKHPIYGSVKIDEIRGKKNNLDIYNYPLNIEYSSKEETISILFVGQSGTGKSTFINAYINHLLDITSTDNIRYKIIFGDANKENDQTQSQTDYITIYNIRSPKYDNKVFQLIDTPGAGDTRNDNDKQISKLEKDKKEKEYLKMYTELFSKEIGKLNSIVFVVKSSENRENEFQKRVIKLITDLFADDVSQNCLAILTHTDNDEIVPNAVQLLEKMDIFKEKTKKNEEWYFPVSSTSYFIPFKIGAGSTTEPMFKFTEKSFIDFTEKLLSLQVYYTKETKKNLELKNTQEKIIQILKNNILTHLLDNIKKLKDNQINLNKKIEECAKQEDEIDKIKTQIENEEKIKDEMQVNFEIHKKLKEQKQEELKKNKEIIESYNKKKEELEKGIEDLEKQQSKAEKEKKDNEEIQEKLRKDILQLEKEIKDKKDQILKKKYETQETEEMKKLKDNLDKSKVNIEKLEEEIKLKKEAKETEEIERLKKSLEEKELKIKEIDNEINKRKNQGETKEMKRLKISLEETKTNICSLKISISRKTRYGYKKEIEELKKSLEISKKKYKEIDKEIKDQNNQEIPLINK